MTPNDNSPSEEAQPENQEDEGSEPGSATFQGVWPWAGVLTFLLLGMLIRKVWTTPARPPHARGLMSHRCLQELRRVPARQALLPGVTLFFFQMKTLRVRVAETLA